MQSISLNSRIMNESQYNDFTSHVGSPSHGFSAKLTSPKVLAQILKMLNFREDVTITVGVNGLKITAEVSKSFQANAFIQRETFLEYKVAKEIEAGEEETVFNISISTLIECLNLCGAGTGMSANTMSSLPTNYTNISNLPTTSMMLYYSDSGDPLRIWLEEDGVISGKNLVWHSPGGIFLKLKLCFLFNLIHDIYSGATIPTMDGGDTLSFDDAHHNTNVIARIIMLTELLKDVIQELDSKCDCVEFVMCPVTKVFSMSTYGTDANLCLEIPFDSEIVSHSEVNEYICVRYQLSLLKHALKPISMAEKVSIRIDAKKLLSIQYMIQLNDDTKSYMEFYCAPDIDIE